MFITENAIKNLSLVLLFPLNRKTIARIKKGKVHTYGAYDGFNIIRKM